MTMVTLWLEMEGYSLGHDACVCVCLCRDQLPPLISRVDRICVSWNIVLIEMIKMPIYLLDSHHSPSTFRLTDFSCWWSRNFSETPLACNSNDEIFHSTCRFVVLIPLQVVATYSMILLVLYLGHIKFLSYCGRFSCVVVFFSSSVTTYVHWHYNYFFECVTHLHVWWLSSSVPLYFNCSDWAFSTWLFGFFLICMEIFFGLIVTSISL